MVVHGAFFSAYRKRHPLPRRVSAMIASYVAWCLGAAASGVVGNVAYEALKALVAKLRGKDDATKHFTEIVVVREYEVIRVREHGDVPPLPEVPPSVIRALEEMPERGHEVPVFAARAIASPLNVVPARDERPPRKPAKKRAMARKRAAPASKSKRR